MIFLPCFGSRAYFLPVTVAANPYSRYSVETTTKPHDAMPTLMPEFTSAYPPAPWLNSTTGNGPLALACTPAYAFIVTTVLNLSGTRPCSSGGNGSDWL